MTAVAEHKASNSHLKHPPPEDGYRQVCDARDTTLPGLMLAALQINIRGGRAPAAEDNGQSYLKIPLDHFDRR
ncbi:hypothetical protein DLJ49_18615 [Rhodovulum sp. 12E13]|uniref:hypothetical protein n=1 Tax=Rhodovulum sp. 12E13 TaxID=2203891 RepID=UPI000E12FA5D|nr:hypothetical protein [Rhodovulum sp. 12E13]RDC69704.1 hypothetical protein DLJ49_18615 [Rhodovulum sp. 12E13]